MKKYVTSKELVRRPFDMPATLAKLLQAAGVEARAPEDVGGLLFGCLAHLSLGIHAQYPEEWPTFRAAFIEACDDLRDVLSSPDPAKVVRGIMERQSRAKQSMTSSTAGNDSVGDLGTNKAAVQP